MKLSECISLLLYGFSLTIIQILNHFPEAFLKSRKRKIIIPIIPTAMAAA